MSKSPCYGCEERHIGCHADCERDSKWREERQAEKDAFNAEKQRESVINEFRAKNASKTRRYVKKRGK